MNLAAWGSFYAVVGGSAGALIGLQFVVLTLVAGSTQRVDSETVNAFGTPTVVHFGSVLTLSAVLSAPWSSVSGVSVAIALGGVAGFLYSIVVFRRAMHQSGYRPVAEDWLWFVILPSVLYAALALAGALLHWAGQIGLFVIGGTALGLLLVGIRNAWDTVIHVTVNEDGSAPKKE